MTDTEFTALTEKVNDARDDFEAQMALLKADVAYYKQANIRLVDEVVPLREQMTAPHIDEASRFEVEHDGAKITLYWSADNRWSQPEIVAIYHGVCCIYGAWGDGYGSSVPTWATKALAEQIAELEAA